MGNALNTLSNATKEDTKLYNCIKELYEQGVPFEELKALIPDMKRTREQLRIKRMLENNNDHQGDVLPSGCKRTPAGRGIPQDRPADPTAAELPQGIIADRRCRKIKENAAARFPDLMCRQTHF